MFVGRDKELKALKSRTAKRSASFVVIKGRRRIGKSRLITEFAKDFPVRYLFTGLPPAKHSSDRSQKEEFVRQMKRQGLPAISSEDWGDIFWVLGKACERGPVVIVLDEIAWMGSKDPNFLGKLKIAWDQYFEANPNLILIVASSISSWIEKNILQSTGFLGRVDLTLTLKELSIKECIQFWSHRNKGVTPYEKLKVLGVTGGVPKYLSEINPKKTAEENIREWCFTDSGLLFNEFERIFHDLFSKRSSLYKDIVRLLVDRSSLTQKEICQGVDKKRGRAISEYLKDLVTAGFLMSDYSWSLKSHEVSKLRKYRLSDNYLRFYLKFIEPRKTEILQGKYEEGSLFDFMQWDSIMGLQFENLVAHNHKELLKVLKIPLSECIRNGPYFQTATQRRKGCQIDYLIQTKSTLYVCEVKFSRHPVGLKVIEEMEQKIEALDIPRHVSYRPVLIHVSGVSDEVVAKDYFDHIIDWSNLLK